MQKAKITFFGPTTPETQLKSTSPSNPLTIFFMSNAAAIEEVFREEHAKVFAFLFRQLGDFAAAEDALQDAFVMALSVWSREGIPARPAAWITTVARNRGTSAKRHERLVQRKHELLLRDAEVVASPLDADDIPDERLKLIFTCCHPSLSEEARVALTLQTVCGLSTPSIARLFLVSEGTVSQRLVRAKRKILSSGIPYAIPSPEAIDERIVDVLSVVYLLFTEGYAPAEGEGLRPELCQEAIRLGRVVVHLMPRHPEACGLVALMILHDARRAARTDSLGDILALEDQDRSLWNLPAIREGTRLLEEALALGRPGPYQIQAAIAALHVNSASAAHTDWAQIEALYEVLFFHQPSAPVALNWAVARGMAQGPSAGLAALSTFEADGVLNGGPLLAAAKADLFRRAGTTAEAYKLYSEAIVGARNQRQARFFERRRGSLE